MNVNLSDEQIYELAKPLIRIVTEYYKDPKNEEDFQKWLLERDKQESTERSL